MASGACRGSMPRCHVAPTVARRKRDHGFGGGGSGCGSVGVVGGELEEDEVREFAFLLITLCMFYLFRSVRILVCSLIPNLVPLVITAGVMGWAF